MVCGVIEKNPCAGVPLKFITQGKSRQRTLSRPEVGKFLRTLYASDRVSKQDKRALHLILLTLVRKSELRLAQWRHINFEAMEWEIPAEHSKTGKPHIVYLCPRTAELLKGQLPLDFHFGEKIAGEYLFPSPGSKTQPLSANTWNMALGRVNFQMGHFTIHDLRRTAATILAEEGFAPDVIEKALNHTIKGVRGIYNRAEYSEQRKVMLARWAEMVEELMK
jgi:integrase